MIGKYLLSWKCLSKGYKLKASNAGLLKQAVLFASEGIIYFLYSLIIIFLYFYEVSKKMNSLPTTIQKILSTQLETHALFTTTPTPVNATYKSPKSQTTVAYKILQGHLLLPHVNSANHIIVTVELLSNHLGLSQEAYALMVWALDNFKDLRVTLEDVRDGYKVLSGKAFSALFKNMGEGWKLRDRFVEECKGRFEFAEFDFFV